MVARRILATAFFIGAIISTGFIPLNDDFTPHLANDFDTLVMLGYLSLSLLCLIGGTIALLPDLRR